MNATAYAEPSVYHQGMSDMTYDYEAPDDAGRTPVTEESSPGYASATYEDEDGTRHGTFTAQL